MQTTNEKYYINNHLSFIVSFHQNLETHSARVVGFEVKAFSINHEYDDQWGYINRLSTCDPRAKRSVTGFDPPQEVDDQEEVIFTYDVEFRESDIKWASRWDTYLLTADDQIHWFSTVNSLMIVLSISGMVAMIMLRTLHRDIFEYDQLDNLEEAQEQTGWKLVHMDVFRPPVNSQLLCVLVGTGVHLLATILITIIFMVSGILSPSNLLDEYIFVTVVVWALTGIFGGWAMARLLYKTFGESEWNMKASLTTAFVFPGTVFCILYVLYSLTSSGESWRAVLYDSMVSLLLLLLVISAPLVFMGSYICFTFIGPETKETEKTSKIPREIPEQSWYMSPIFTIMVGGIIPFVVVFELSSMLTSIDLHHFCYMFGMVFVILIITCAEVTIVLCYFQLCREDYRWCWRSYLTAGSSAFYVFIYATFYFFTEPNITELVPGVFYFGYLLIASSALFMLTGTIGFYACLWFIRRIYASLAIV
ncbi:putative nonaspanin (TM9SF) [Helianthus debilis subsp. tardiflorus]